MVIKLLTIQTFEVQTNFKQYIKVSPEGKDYIPSFDKSMVIYQFKWYYDNSYTGLTTRQLKKRVKKHIPTCIDKFLKSAEKEKEKKFVKIMSTIKNLLLVNNQSCAENFNLEIFKIIKSCCNVFDLVKMEAICILNRKPILCR